MKKRKLDCVLIGYNDIDFDTFAARQKRMAKQAGGYHEIKTNSLFLNGKRETYMTVLNRAFAAGAGWNPQFNVFESPSLGACYLKNFLNQKGLGAEVINFFTRGKDQLRALLELDPVCVAITTTFYIDSAPIAEVVKYVKRHNPKTKVIVGGPHIYNLSSDLDMETLGFLFHSMGADIYVVDSQGEQTLSRVVEHLAQERGSELSLIPNLIYRRANGDWHQTDRQPENNDLNQNSIDWNRFDKKLVTPLAYLRTARSCPFKCTFCNYPTMAGAHVVSDVDVLEIELRTLGQMGTTHLVFIDDTFNVPLPRFKNILRMMIRIPFDFKWVSFFRCGNADEETVALMKESGCIGVLLGIESGDPDILKYMNKAAKPEKYKSGIDLLNRYEIASFTSLICGFPGETDDSIQKTIAFLEEAVPTFFNVQLYYHDLRAPIHQKADAFGIRGAGYNWQHNTMTWQEAAQKAGDMFSRIHNAIPLGLYGFSLWGIAYLISQNITMDQIKAFGRITRDMLIDSIAEEPKSYPEKERQLAALFGTHNGSRGPWQKGTGHTSGESRWASV